MWIAEVLNNTNHVINEYLLRGPELKIGRLNGDDYIPIIQSNDKTVSRDHARVTIMNDILSIKDNNSKFGTFIDEKTNTKITESYQIKSGQIIKFGAATTRIRFIRCQYVFSTTLISKDEREKIKKLSKVLGARISNNVEDSSHLICPKYGATTKMLTAIVMEKKIIVVNWLSFIEEETSISLIPKCVDFSPPANDEFNSYVATAHLKRSELLRNYTVFITTKTDLQYAPIFKQCGTNIIDLSHIDDKSLLKRTIKNTDLPNDTSVVCIFYDMINYKTGSTAPLVSVSPLVDASFIPENESIGFGEENLPLLWLSAEKLAVSIIKCEQPEISRYFMASNKSQLSSQKSFTTQYQFDTLNQNSAISPLPPKSPTANPKLNINISNIVKPNAATNEKDNQTIEVTKPLVPVFVTDSQKSKHSPLKVSAQAKDDLKRSEVHREFETTEIVKVTAKRGRNDNVYDGDDAQDNTKRRKSQTNTAMIDDLQLSNDVRMTNDIDEVIIEEEIIEEDNIMDPYLELQALQDYENNNERTAADDDGWIAPPPLNLRKAIAEKNRKKLDEEYKFLEPAETKRVKNLIRKVIPDRRITSNRNFKNPKDQRKFKKNLIFFATDDELLYCKDMEKVLPKESSREKQLRLEEEQIQEELISSDEDDNAIMAKHFGKKKTTRKGRK